MSPGWARRRADVGMTIDQVSARVSEALDLP
jgi:hypothetical protein